MPNVFDEYGVSVSNRDNYRAPFDHDVWFNSMGSDHMWRSNNASTLSDFYRFQSRKVNGDLAVGQIEAVGNVDIETAGDVTDASSFAYIDILANDITIRSIAGSIGEHGNDLELDSIPETGSPGFARLWSQLDSGNRHIYLREFSGGVWQEICGSASFGGVSANFFPQGERLHNQSPSVAFVRNELLVAWQSFSDAGGSVLSVAFQKDFGVWGPPTPIDSFGTSGHDAQPRLVSNSFDARLVWANDERTIYARSYDSGQWIEAVAGEASGTGIKSGSIRIDSLVAASDPNGLVTVSWIDSANDRSSLQLLVEDQPEVLPRVIESTINGDSSNPNRSGIATLAVRFSQSVVQSSLGGTRSRCLRRN